MRFSLYEGDQKKALVQLATLARNDSIKPEVFTAARQIVQSCDARDDHCEIHAVYDAVKTGTPLVPGLESGVRYSADPNYADHFTSPRRLLLQCRDGACAEDCDGQSALVASMLASLGFKAGLRAWGPKDRDDYVHVYAVVMTPKKPKSGQDWDGYVPLDTTVVYPAGWEPPSGRILTVWI